MDLETKSFIKDNFYFNLIITSVLFILIVAHFIDINNTFINEINKLNQRIKVLEQRIK